MASRTELGRGEEAGVDRTDGAIPEGAMPRPSGHWAAIILIAGFAIAVGAAAAVADRLATAEDVPTIVRHDDLTVDLLGWLPASDETRRSFAVWVDEGAVGATPPAVMDVGLQASLGMAPLPRTLGATPGWRAAFGWAAGDVTAWAAGGEAGDGVAILAGEFDLEAIDHALETAGYRATTYRRVPLYVLHPVATPVAAIDGAAAGDANAVGLLAGRVITAPDERDVRDAIDAALGFGPSLADDRQVAALLRTVGANAGLAVLDAADLAAICFTDDPTARAAAGVPSGRYVAAVYGRTGPDGPRQTTILVTFGGVPGASVQEAAAAWEYGWVDAGVALGAVSAPAAAYARIDAAGATADTLIARFGDGRVAGWAPVALRLASPVCLAVADLAPAAAAPLGTPVAPATLAAANGPAA